MQLDIRYPMGLLFGILGLIIAAYGLVANDSNNLRLDININLWWGLVMLGFGAVMFILARSAQAKQEKK